MGKDVNSHADGLAIKFCWVLKVYMLENSLSAILPAHNIMISFHITGIASTTATRTFRRKLVRAVAMPISTSTSDLDV